MARMTRWWGTRKGLFMIESEGARSDWSIRGPYCEGWPIYHAVHDPESGDIYAAAASEWHGAGVWRSADRARPGSCPAKDSATARRAS